MAGALEALVRSVQPGSVLAEVQRQWPAAVGETIAGWARPVAEKAGVVVVECDDSVIAHELEMIKTELLGKLRERIETGAPRELKFRVG
ncbi:MAG: DUF721 domain-containing protein [Thermoleophilia bacterium]|nr:DUF721 domain-containing protein [Thermoleophilia bacterium]